MTLLLCICTRVRFWPTERAKLPFRWKYASLLPLAACMNRHSESTSSIPFDSIRKQYARVVLRRRTIRCSAISPRRSRIIPLSPVPLKAKALEYQVMLLKELSQDSDEYKFNLGEYYFLTGMKEKATVLLEEIIDSQPANSNRGHVPLIIFPVWRVKGAMRLLYLLSGYLSHCRCAVGYPRCAVAAGAGYRSLREGRCYADHSYLSYALANAVECGAPLHDRCVEVFANHRAGAHGAYQQIASYYQLDFTCCIGYVARPHRFNARIASSDAQNDRPADKASCGQ